MAETTVKAEMDVPAARLWALVRDFGSVPWLPGGESAIVEGEGVGMVRSLAGGAIREQLESRDEAGQRIGYTILEGLPVPARDYHATMTVRSLDGGRSELEWSCRFEPDGATAEECVAQFRSLYELMIGWIRDHLGPA